MRSRTASFRRSSKLKTALVMFSVVVIGGVLSAAAAGALGIVDFRAFLKQPAASNPHAGMVAVPLSCTHIPAYTVVTRDHLIDPQSQRTRVLHYSPDKVPEAFLYDPEKILGRVMARDKMPGYAFSEKDFLPKGTRPGIVGGIPPGKRAMTLDANQVRGLKQLRIGDRFDLLASEPVDLKGMQPHLRWKNGAGNKNSADASVRVLVDNGAVVTTAAAPDPTSVGPRGNSLMGGGDRAPPAREMTIAIDPDEIAGLTEALATKDSLFCVARSGHPEEKHDTVIPEHDPLENVSTIETLRGREFGMEAFPTAPANSSGKPAAAPKPAEDASDRAGTMRSPRISSR